MASRGSVRSRRSSAARKPPLTVAQLEEVRQLALAMRGAARSVKLHGVVVYLERSAAPTPGPKLRQCKYVVLTSTNC